MPQLLKPARLEPVLHNKRSHCNKKPVHCNEEWPCSPQLEKARGQQQTPNEAKNKKKIKKKEPIAFKKLAKDRLSLAEMELLLPLLIFT